MEIIKKILSVGVLLSASAVAVADSAHIWLERMNTAVHKSSYEGRFVYQVGDKLDSLYLIHRVHNGEEKERLIVLNGPSREVVRNHQAVAVLKPGEKAIHAGTRRKASPFVRLQPLASEQVDKSYDFALLDGSRVAGRESVEIRIKPKDSLRYGYHLFIDKQSYLPLRSIMVDEHANTLSQMMFVDLEVGDSVTTIEHDHSRLNCARGHAAPMEPVDTQSRWSFSDVPPGFVMSVYRASTKDDMIEHFVYSDGLASISIYVEPLDETGFEGVSRMGATHAVSINRNAHQLTAVGEAPIATLKYFLNSVEYRE